MSKLKNKLKKQGGFTLIEMLIVVAIIAILIAISIPLVSTALEKAREATDAANERAAIALGTIAYATIEPGDDDDVGINTSGGSAYYVVSNASDSDASGTGTLAAGPGGIAYGKGTEAGSIKVDHVGQILLVTVTDEGVVTAEWGPLSSGSTGDTGEGTP